jgi:hypothetical protein
VAESDRIKRRVFIAATYDLENERRVASDAIKRAGAIPVSVEWWEPATLIGRAVSECDLLLMVLGRRSGSITPTNITFLEYEYRLARRAGIPVAAVIFRDQGAERGPWFFERLEPDFTEELGNIEELPRAVETVIEMSSAVPRRAVGDSRFGILHVEGGTSSAAGDVGQWIMDLDTAYSGILAFFEIISDAFVALRPQLSLDLLARTAARDLLAPSERLRFYGASFSSPGWWEVFGKLNPLEVIRQYLNDRHEHRKDREYREAADRRRLDLENELLQTKVVGEKLRLAREIGVPERDLTAAVNKMLLKPLRQIGAAQDDGIIQTAEIIEPPLLGAPENLGEDQ